MNIKAIKIIMWICISLLAVQFLGAGITKLLGRWSVQFAKWNYPLAFAYVIGSFEIVGVVGLFFSKTRKWSALLFVLIMVGAACTHISSSEYPRLIHNAIVAGLSFLVIQLNRKSSG